MTGHNRAVVQIFFNSFRNWGQIGNRSSTELNKTAFPHGAATVWSLLTMDLFSGLELAVVKSGLLPYPFSSFYKITVASENWPERELEIGKGKGFGS